ncbi:sulfite exporter TauE/SafE family protein [Candidatus Uhrbacteria bacterium]|nr:sulfite exporter TauE/SafE family protein [Candidatus Uhrbacteria bacterium]
MSNKQLKQARISIDGMTCGSCELLIERKLEKINGMVRVGVHHQNGSADLYYTRTPSLQELTDALRDTKYTVSLWREHNTTSTPKNSRRDLFEIGTIFLVVVGAYLILSSLKIIPSLGVTENMSYGFVFLIGLVAATSTCMAVAGGLLLAVTVRYNELHPQSSRFEKFKLNIFFNIGRIVSYAGFGFLIGLAGSAVTFSPRLTGIITIMASIVMIMLGIKLLRLFPGLTRFQPKMPKGIAKRLQDYGERHPKIAPFFFGVSTFFLPCGFTQALQLYVLSKGDPGVGALTMLIFSLGTLPALVSIGIVSSIARGSVQRYFLKFAGVTVILLGFFNVANGMTLTGITLPRFGKVGAANGSDQMLPVSDGKQIAEMTVRGLDYYPHRFTVESGIPVEWRIDGRDAEGCAQVIVVPKLGITTFLKRSGITTVEFTPQETGTIAFSCSMGMTTPGSAFTVVPATAGARARETDERNSAVGTTEVCDSAMGCSTQTLVSEVSHDKWFEPNFFVVKKGKPVELTIDAKIPLGGCMSVLTIPKFEIAQLLTVGRNTIRFTPTESGEIPVTCSMGSEMLRITVI